MNYLSARVGKILESKTIMMNQRARELKAEGRTIFDLSVGEPDFPTPKSIRESAKQAIDEGYTKYTPVAGYPELLSAISRKFARENGLAYPQANIMVSCGAKQALANAALSLIDPGDEVIIPAPYWVSYVEIVKLAQGSPVIVDTSPQKGFKLSPDELARAITAKTKALILNSPSNPAGAVYTLKEFEALAAVMEKHSRIWVLSDEVYEHINFTGAHASPASIPSLFERTVTINGVSKAYSMTGWRIGYLGGPLPLVKAAVRLQGQTTTSAASISQRAALAALESGTAEIETMRKAFLGRRDLVIGRMAGIPGITCVRPDGAFYVFPDVSAFFRKDGRPGYFSGSEDIAGFLLEKAGVALVPGSAFGRDSCLRISFASSEETLNAAFDKIADSFKSMKR